MDTLGPRTDLPASELVRDAIEDTRELVRIEVALAKDELRKELFAARTSIIGFAVAAVTSLIGLIMLLVALALGIYPGPIPALVIGLVLVLVAGTAAFIGWQSLPKKPMSRTQKRLETDVNIVKEHIA
jgi:uncharacterized membrane protein YqjE